MFPILAPHPNLRDSENLTRKSQCGGAGDQTFPIAKRWFLAAVPLELASQTSHVQELLVGPRSAVPCPGRVDNMPAVRMRSLAGTMITARVSEVWIPAADTDGYRNKNRCKITFHMF